MTSATLVCPHCEHEVDGEHTPVNEAAIDHPGKEPGDVTICSGCAGVAIFDDDLMLRKATADEVEGFKDNEDFQSAIKAIELHIAIHKMREGGEDQITFNSGSMALKVGFDEDGNPHFPDGVPPRMTEALEHILMHARVDRMAKEVQTHVTQEVANHVLAVYGHETASHPNVTTGALISLIRLCVESDEAMLDELNRLEFVHGYILAVTTFMEPSANQEDNLGREMLEQIAGLRPWEDGNPFEAHK